MKAPALLLATLLALPSGAPAAPAASSAAATSVPADGSGTAKTAAVQRQRRRYQLRNGVVSGGLTKDENPGANVPPQADPLLEKPACDGEDAGDCAN